MTQIAVAIINYNTCEYLRVCLKSVLSEAPREVVVVDNVSTDGSIEMVRNEFPQIMLHANKINRGYGAAANQAMASCSTQYVLLLNSDTRLQPGALQSLTAYLDLHPQAGIVGPRLVNVDGTLQVSCYPFPTPLGMIIKKISVRQWIQKVPVLRDHYLYTWSHSYARVVPWVKGAAMLIRRDAFDAVGGFDESFFMYFEEVDLCHRLQAAGWQVHFSPITTVGHVGGASTECVQTEMMIQLYTNTRRFYQRHYSKLRLIELLLVVKSFILIRLVRDSLRFHITRDAHTRAIMAEAVATWQGILLKYSLRQVTRD